MINNIHQGDCLQILKTFESNSMDSLVADPPAGISFMSKSWDDDKGGRKQWIAWMAEVMTECLRVLKPGAHGLVWAIPRTSHWTATALEDAGFTILDVCTHLFGSGFPKSTNIQKSAEKQGLICKCVIPDHYEKETNSSKGMCSLQERVGSEESNPIHQKQNLLSGMCESETQNRESRSEKETSRNLQAMQEGILDAEQGAVEGNLLQLQVFSEIEESRSKVKKSHERDCSPRSSGMDTRKHEELSPENVWGQESCMGGRQIHRTGQGICDGPKSEASKGETQRIRTGTHSSNGEEVRSISETERSSSSHQSQSPGQSNREPTAIQGPQDSLGGSSQGGLHCSKCGKLKKEKIEGFGTHLKPAAEFWILCKKPISESTIAKNVLKHGVGGINIDASRIVTTDKLSGSGSAPLKHGGQNSRPFHESATPLGCNQNAQGRFPANLILSHNPDCVEVGTNEIKTDSHNTKASSIYGSTMKWSDNDPDRKYTETVAAFECTEGCAIAELDKQSEVSRFFYCAKASKKDKGSDNTHPTIKSSALMSYLIKLITPPGGLVLDPFMGSGSTGVAAVKNGFKFIGIEQNQEYIQIAEKRIYHHFPEFKKEIK